MTERLNFQSLLNLAQYYLAKRDHSTYELTGKLTKYCLLKQQGIAKNAQKRFDDNDIDSEALDFGLSSQTFHLDAELLRRIDEVIEYCQSHRWLDDTRFTQSYIASNHKKGAGKNKLKQSLYQKGINKTLINQCLNDADIDWFLLARETAVKKFKLSDTSTLSIRLEDKAKISRFLQSRGFSFDEINAIFD